MSSALVVSLYYAFNNMFENFVMIYRDHNNDIRAIFDNVVDPLDVCFNCSISNLAKTQIKKIQKN